MSLTARILISFVLVSSVGLFLVLNPIFDRVRRQYLEAAEEPMVDAAEILAAIVSESLAQGDGVPVTITRAMDAVDQRKLQARIYDLEKARVLMDFYITDEKGVVLYDSRFPENVGKNFAHYLDVHRTLRGQYGARASVIEGGEKNEWALFVAAPLIVQGEIVGVLTVSKPTESMFQFISETRRWIFALGVTGVGVFLLVGFLFSRWITGPLERLTRHAEAISAGERPPPPRVPGRHLRVLSNALERMRDALEDRAYVESYVRTLSHEMKAPVAAINGAAELLDEEMPLDRRQTFLSNIRTESARLQRLIEQLLALASLEKRRRLETPQVIDLAKLVAEAVASSRSRAGHLRFETDLEPGVMVRAEPFLLSTALSNLLQNAVDFSPDGGCIRVRLRSDHENGIMEIEDEGPGIPEYARKRVFERFYSLPRPGSGRKSSGLGLCFVAEAVALHDGTITLARINHQLRRETQREAGWSKAGAGLWKGCMRTYRPHRNPSPTPLQPASRKSQQMAGDFSGLDSLGSKAAPGKAGTVATLTLPRER